jgi:exosortase J
MNTGNESAEGITPALPPAKTNAAGWKPDLTVLALLWGCVALLFVLGCLGFSRELTFLWMIWTTDPLRSIGMLIPPVSILLTLRTWRSYGWEMRGTWWGLLLLALAFGVSILKQSIVIQSMSGWATFNPIPTTIPLFLYGCGIMLLFAGPRVVRKAWFPLGLLLLCQPVPSFFMLLDLPLQHISAHVARSFATLIGFAPTTPQLRLMFSPNFGMFIAPGCDGIRGAVTMGYLALILGYLKRVSVRRWAAYVAGGVLLGYLFNFTRLCVLVLYYRLALGHPALENVAKMADYGIGSCLFLLATFLFLRLLHRQEDATGSESAPDPVRSSACICSLALKCAAFAAVVLATLSLTGSVLREHRTSTALPISYADRMPKKVGDYALTRTWYEQQTAGTTVVQAGAYSAPGSDEITLAVWVAPTSNLHNGNDCLLVRGIEPTTLTTQSFITAQGKLVDFRTGSYSDGITDSIVANAVCALGSCLQSTHAVFGSKLEFQYMGYAQKQAHPVSFTIRVEKPASGTPKADTYKNLSSELQTFLAGLDTTHLSQSFQ